MSKDIKLRTTFNSKAELYRAVRPIYPQSLFETLIQTTHLTNDACLLEIGPGTGQATLPMAEQGYSITAIELGENLAEVLQDVVKEYKNVQIITGAFEDIELPAESFDLIYAATSFHWIKIEYRFTKPHKLLKPKGHLAIIYTAHVSDEARDLFFYASQPIYKKYTPDNNVDENFKLPCLMDLRPLKADESLFEHVLFKAFPIAISYTADEYINLLSTYSTTISLKPKMRTKFLESISSLINKQFGGSIVKYHGMVLTIMRKKD